MVKYINVDTEEDFEEIIKKSGDKLVVADFWATWCGPCRMIGPHFEKMSEEEVFANVIFIKVDVDEVGELAEEYDVECMPTFLFFKNGEKLEHMSGANKEKLRESIKKYM